MYRRSASYFVHANLRTNAGVWVASMPASLLPINTTSESLGSAIAEALANASIGASLSPREPVLEVARVRSWSALQRSAALCNVWQTARTFVVEPTRNGGNAGDDKGYHPLSDQTIAVAAACSSSELGQAVLIAFGRCR